MSLMEAPSYNSPASCFSLSRFKLVYLGGLELPGRNLLLEE